MHFPALNSMLSRRVSAAERAFSVSFATSGTHFGTMLTGAVGSVLLDQFGWVSPFYFIGIIILFCCFFYTYWVDDKREVL